MITTESDPVSKDSPIEIRHFDTPAEIRGLPRFAEDAPVSKATYSRLLGHYKFPREEFRCSVLEQNGKLCREWHGEGFAVLLLDGSITVIGIVCGRTKFDGDRLKGDIARYNNERARKDRLARLAELLRGKEIRLQELGAIRQEVLAVRQRAQGFKNGLGPRTIDRLESMARAKSSRIMVKVVSRRTYEEDGVTKYETTRTEVPIGTLGGAAIMARAVGDELLATISSVCRAFAHAEAVTDDIRTVELDRLNSEMAKADRVRAEADALQQQERDFLTSDWSMLCFLVADRVERYEAAKVAMLQAGTRPSKDGAKRWFADKEAELRNRFNATSIEIV